MPAAAVESPSRQPSPVKLPMPPPDPEVKQLSGTLVAQRIVRSPSKEPPSRQPEAAGGSAATAAPSTPERGQLQLDALERTDERVAWASGGSTRLWRRREGGESIVVKLLPLTDKRLRDEAMRELETLYVQRLSF